MSGTIPRWPHRSYRTPETTKTPVAAAIATDILRATLGCWMVRKAGWITLDIAARTWGGDTLRLASRLLSLKAYVMLSWAVPLALVWLLAQLRRELQSAGVSPYH